jgi:hypothetical protein
VSPHRLLAAANQLRLAIAPMGQALKYPVAVWHKKDSETPHQKQYYAFPLGAQHAFRGEMYPLLDKGWEFDGVVPQGMPIEDCRTVPGKPDMITGKLNGMHVSTARWGVVDVQAS